MAKKPDPLTLHLGRLAGADKHNRARFEGRKRYTRNAAIYPEADLDRPPETLRAEALEVWREMAPVLKRKGVITEADVLILSLICDMVADLRESQALVEEEGLVLVSASGTPLKHPLLAHITTMRGQLRPLLAEIGWTPDSRPKEKDDIENEGDESPDFGDVVT